MTDLTGIAAMSRDEVKALWAKARAEGNKAAEYIVRDHFSQQFGGDASDVEPEPVAAPVEAPAEAPVEVPAEPVAEPVAEAPAAE